MKNDFDFVNLVLISCKRTVECWPLLSLIRTHFCFFQNPQLSGCSQDSWSIPPARQYQVSVMQSFNCNRKYFISVFKTLVETFLLRAILSANRKLPSYSLLTVTGDISFLFLQIIFVLRTHFCISKTH